VLVTDIERRDQAIAVINKVIVELAAPYHIDSTPVSMTASLGSALVIVSSAACRALLGGWGVAAQAASASKPAMAATAQRTTPPD
jgi:predicted signal transduction protein with EAL and GGDEF domain